MNDKVTVEKKILSENDRVAAELRARFEQNRLLVLNLVSSPGSGKTSLLERTIRQLGTTVPMALIAGDVQTENDANRLRSAGAEISRPIVTGGACHLDARMVSREVDTLDLNRLDLLIIENVGNLVCPSSYDLGEAMKVVIISTTEGDDKPLKYPGMFRRSSVMVINKIDLLGMSDFSIERVRKNALRINAGLKIIELSCRSGIGLDGWYQWLIAEIAIRKSGKV